MVQEGDRIKSIIFIIFILVIISLIGAIYYNVMTYHNERLEIICIDNGYKELTDYKNIHTEQIWYDREYWYTFMIECDEKVLNSQYILKLNINRNCAKHDKWGECEYYNREKKYSKPIKSSSYMGLH